MTRETATAETCETQEPSAEAKAEGSWAVAVLFWGTILIAAFLYAAVALSPKLVFYLNLRNDHYQTQVELVTLERKVMYLRKVMHALENDPSYTAEQARVELGTERPGDERIAVDQSLHLAGDADFDPSLFKKSILPWYTELLKVFANDAKTRRGFLITAVGIVLFAFTFFQESQTSQLLKCVRSVKHAWLKATARYRQEHPQTSAGESQDSSASAS